VYPLSLAIVSARYSGDYQRLAVSRLTSSLAVAPMVGVPLVTSLAGWRDWRLAWLALAMLTGVALVALWRMLGSQSTPAQRPPHNVAQEFARLLRHRSSLLLLGGTFSMGTAGWSVWTYLGAFVIHQHGFSTQAAGWAWTVVGVGLFAGTVLAGGRLGKARLDLLFGAAALGTGVCLGAAMLLPVSGWVAVGIVGVGTLLHGITQVVTAILLPEGAPTGKAATMTLRGAASSLGGAAGAALGGVLVASAGFGAVGIAALACCTLAMLLAWLGRTQPYRISPRMTAQAAT
jgi:predicted MFS family arabinose efflux permease